MKERIICHECGRVRNIMKEKFIAELILDIRTAFGSVRFPAHRGIRGAMIVDDWINDPEEIARVTEEKDFHGEWWEVPATELDQCELGLYYLDSAGFLFYLPAIMTRELQPDYSERLKDSRVFHFFDPNSNEEPEGSEKKKVDFSYFYGKFAFEMTEERRDVCRRFIHLVGNENHVHLAIEREKFDRSKRILHHKFWSEPHKKAIHGEAVTHDEPRERH